MYMHEYIFSCLLLFVAYSFIEVLCFQRCLTVPTEDGFDVFSSTQSTTRIQKVVAHVLGITNSRSVFDHVITL